MRPYLDNPKRGKTMTEIEREERSKGFSNRTISPVVFTKPHICIRQGYWRVSPWVPGSGNLFYYAHNFAVRLNYKLAPIEPCAYNRKSGVANGHQRGVMVWEPVASAVEYAAREVRNSIILNRIRVDQRHRYLPRHFTLIDSYGMKDAVRDMAHGLRNTLCTLKD